MRRIITYIALLLVTAMPVMAQQDPTYRREIGVGAGMANYMGDFNGSLTKGYQPAFSIIYRHIYSPYSALKVDMSYAQLKGGSRDATTYYPEYGFDKYSFSRSMGDLNFTYEYNFLPYGTGRDYRGAKRVVPYYFIGLGLTMATGSVPTEDSGTAVALNMPIGIGVKYKVSERVNLGLEWAAHFTGTDKLDGVVDPYMVKSSGIFKNTDCYSMLRATLTYSFSPKCQTCNKYE